MRHEEPQRQCYAVEARAVDLHGVHLPRLLELVPAPMQRQWQQGRRLTSPKP